MDAVQSKFFTSVCVSYRAKPPLLEKVRDVGQFYLIYSAVKRFLLTFKLQISKSLV